MAIALDIKYLELKFYPHNENRIPYSPSRDVQSH